MGGVFLKATLDKGNGDEGYGVAHYPAPYIELSHCEWIRVNCQLRASFIGHSPLFCGTISNLTVLVGETYDLPR
jgi:hypothetical protein